MKKYISIEIICVILTVLFVLSSISTNKNTLKTAEEITGDLVYLLDDDSFIERDLSFVKEAFEIDLSDFSSVSYYSSDDIMDVTELFVGVLKSEFSDNTKNSFTSYIDDKYNLFNGYAPEQAAYIDAYILDESSGAVVFCVAKDADTVYEAFLDTVG